MTYEEALQIAMEELYDAVEVLRRNNKGYPSRVDLECNRLLTARNALHKGLEEMQAKREWVGLTDEELEFFIPCCEGDWEFEDYREFAMDIQAKLKEKNA